MLQRIGALTDGRIREILTEVAAAMRTAVPWLDDSVHALRTRANRLPQIMESLWSAN